MSQDEIKDRAAQIARARHHVIDAAEKVVESRAGRGWSPRLRREALRELIVAVRGMREIVSGNSNRPALARLT